MRNSKKNNYSGQLAYKRYSQSLVIKHTNQNNSMSFFIYQIGKHLKDSGRASAYHFKVQTLK